MKPQKAPRLSRLEVEALKLMARFDLRTVPATALTAFARRYAARKLRELLALFPPCIHAPRCETLNGGHWGDCSDCQARSKILSLSKSTTPRRDGGRGKAR